MNDIEILEELLAEGFSAMCPLEAEAIENLIKEYKDVNKEVLHWIDQYNLLKDKISKYKKQLDLDFVEENYIPKSKLKNVKNYIENKMDIVDNPTICGDEEDTITELPISLCLYNEDLRKLLELLED